MSVTYAYAADIVKHERNPDGNLVVYGKATGPDLDLDGQICDPAWLKKAMPDWMTFGNMREMHGPIAAGVGIELEAQGDDWWLKSLCVDPGTANKIENGVLRGYSIGIKNAKVVKDADAPNGRIVGGSIVENSYVDRPCNPTATYTFGKSANGQGPLLAVEAPQDEPVGDNAPGARPDVVEPAKGDAPSGGEAGVTAADALGSSPETSAESAEKVLTRGVGRTILAGLRTLKHRGQPVTITKGAPAEDIASAEACMSAIGALIEQEAQGLVAGEQQEASQISCLLRAYEGLQYFCYMESREIPDDGDDAASVEVVLLANQPDTTKVATVTTEPAKTEIVPAKQGGDSAEADGQEKRIKALETQLAKVLSQPVPGGPVLTRRTEEISTANARETLMTKAAEYDRMAIDYQAIDPRAADGYRALAAAARSSVPA